MSFKEIKKTDPDISQLEGAIFNVDNGDLIALNKIKDQWNFKDKESVFRYALAVMVQAETHTLYIEKNGSKNSLAPNESLLKEEDGEAGSENNI